MGVEPFVLRFVTDLKDVISDVKSFGDTLGQASKTVGQMAEGARVVTDGLNTISAAATRNAETIAAVAVATQTAVTAEEAEATELARLTELLGSEANARASLNSRIIDLTVSQRANAQATETSARATQASTAANRSYGESMEARAAAFMRGEAAESTATQRVNERLAAFRRLTPEELAARRSQQALQETLGGFAERMNTGSVALSAFGAVLPGVGGRLVGLGANMGLAGQAASTLGTVAAEAEVGVAGLAGVLGGLLGPALAVVAALVVVGTGAKLVFDALKEGGQQLSEEDHLARYVGSLEEARKRLDQIDAASVTSIPVLGDELVKANEKLTLFSHGALGTAADLKMVADAAIATQKPIGTMAQAVGGLEAALASGQAPSRYATQLQRMGVLTPGVVNELNNLHKQQKSGSEIWEVARQAISRWSGESENAALTSEGTRTRISNVWRAMLAEFGAPIVDALTPLLRDLVPLLAKMVPIAKEAGEAIGGAIEKVYGLVKNGEFSSALAAEIRVGVSEGVVFFISKFMDAVNTVKNAVRELFSMSEETRQKLASYAPNAGGADITGHVDGEAPPQEDTDDYYKRVTGYGPALPVNASPLQRAQNNLAGNLAQRNASLIRAEDTAHSNAPTYTKPVTGTGEGDDTAPITKSSGGAGKADNSDLLARRSLLTQLSNLEREYAQTVKLTDVELALGEKTPAEAERQNIQTIQSYLGQLKGLQQQLEFEQNKLISLPQTPKTLADLAKIKEAIAQVTTKQKEMRLEAMKQTPLGNIRLQLTQLANQWTDLAKVAGNAAREIAQTLATGVGNAITGLITKTKTWGQAFAEVGTSIISMLAQIVVSYIAGRLIMMAIDAIFGKQANNSSMQSAGQVAAAWAPAATSVSIATEGQAAGTGVLAYIGALAAGTAAAAGASALGGYERGGYTGGREGQPAGIVHGEEFVFSAPSVRHWGIDTLHALSQMRIPVRAPQLSTAAASVGGYSPTGRAAGPRGGRGGGAQPIHLHYHADENAMKKFISGKQGRHIVLSHVNGHAVDLGNPTT